MSKLLHALNIDHTLVPCPMDGDCFYHAVAHQLDHVLTHKDLRYICAHFLREEDAIMMNVIRNKNYGLKRWRTETIRPYKYWADDVEINSVVRGLPIVLYIVDDNTSTMYRIGQQVGTKQRRSVYVQRIGEHYNSLIVLNSRKLNNTMKDKTSYEVQTDDSHTAIIFLIVLVLIANRVFHALVK